VTSHSLFFTELCVSATFCVSFHAGSSLEPFSPILAPDLKIELGVIGLHILPKSGIWQQKWLLPFDP
jgi:hypothetical protein